MFPLISSKEGEEVDIHCLSCDCDNACKLREMGCAEGVAGRIIAISKNVILEIGTTRLAITNDLAKRILVTPRS